MNTAQITSRYEDAKALYAGLGIDTEEAFRRLEAIPISLHCWQGDDVRGFDGAGALDGGLQVTGDYPGRARTPEELMADLDAAYALLPGTHKLNLHASYAILDGAPADRDSLEPKHFAPWVAFAKARNLGIDFNPTFFSHPRVKDGLTLSSPDPETRAFWVRHGIACLRIAEYFAAETGQPCVVNFWIPDGYKNIPADRMGPRRRFKESLDEILACGYDKSRVYVTLESKVFGIGLEAYTVGSSEFSMSYADKNDVLCLLDNGHYHPTERVADKIPALLLFHDKLALHVTRGVRWDSDHVALFDDEVREIADEIIRCKAENRVLLATDYFDASINRILAWAVGVRSLRKALLCALLTPWDTMTRLQEAADFSQLMALGEALKTLPFGDVWNAFCLRHSAPDDMELFSAVKIYEAQVLSQRS